MHISIMSNEIFPFCGTARNFVDNSTKEEREREKKTSDRCPKSKIISQIILKYS